MQENIVSSVTASIFARQEMNILDTGDVPVLLAAVSEEIAQRLDFENIPERDDYSFLVGAVMATILYEGEHKKATGEFTHFLDYRE